LLSLLNRKLRIIFDESDFTFQPSPPIEKNDNLLYSLIQVFVFQILSFYCLPADDMAIFFIFLLLIINLTA